MKEKSNVKFFAEFKGLFIIKKGKKEPGEESIRKKQKQFAKSVKRSRMFGFFPCAHTHSKIQ